MKEISLTQGKIALIDDEDYERVNQHKWYAHKERTQNYYALKNNTPRARKEKLIITRMHRFIMNARKEVLIDHKDHNGLNNQKYNLRIATYSQNQRNRKKSEKCTSKYKGVHFVNNRKKWCAQIYIAEKPAFLGHFDDEIEAALVYDKAAIIHYGEFAWLNFPGGTNAISI